MDTQRLILFMLFTFSVFFLMDAWQKDRQPQTAPALPTVPAPATATGPTANPVPTPTQPLTPAAPAAAPPAVSGALQKGETVRVETDAYIADIDTAGGDLRRLELLMHRDTLDHKKNFVLLQQQGEHTYVAQSGLIGNGLPNHRTRYTGMAVYTDKEKFQKVAFADVDKGKIGYPKKSNDGWIALLQHYFLSAWLPANNAPREFYTQRLDNGLYTAGVILSLGSIEPGASRALTVPLYRSEERRVGK